MSIEKGGDSVAKADGSIVIDITADPKKAVSGLNTVQGKMNSVASTAKKLAGVIGSAFAIHKLIDFGKEAIQIGSDIEEVQNVVDVSFGEMSYKAEKFANEAIQNFGMSSLAAKRTASTYMSMAKNMGFSTESASDMAISLAGLTGDVASFYNISQELADVKLKSVFTGETETLKDLGVVMTQANLEAYALNQGITKSISSMSQAELVALRYNFVMDQLAMASGDFVRTQDSWANQTRILSMQWQEFMGIIGQALTQILLPVVKVLNAIISQLINMANALKTAISSLFGGGGGNTQLQQEEQSVSNISSEIDGAVENQKALTSATKKTNKEQQKSLATFDEISILQNSSSSKSGDSGGSSSSPALHLPSSIASNMVVSPNVDKTAEAIKQKFQALSKWFTKTFEPSISSWGSAFAKLQKPAEKAASSISSSFGNLWQGTLAPFGGYLLQEWIPNIVNAFSTTFAPIFSDVMTVAIEEFSRNFDFMCLQIGNLVNDVLRPAFEFIGTMFSDICGAIKSTWDEYGAGLLENIQKFCDSMRELWQNLYDNIFKPILEGFGNTISWLWDNHLKYLWENITDFIASVSEMIMTIWNNFLSPIVNWLVEVLGPVIANVVNRIGDVIGTVFGVISDVIGGIIKALTGLSDFITGVFSGDWNKAWEGIQKFFGGIWDAIWGIVKGVVNLIIDGINMLWSGIYTVISAIVNALGSVAGAVGFLFGQDWHFSMPSSPPLIPKLAQGAVIPPNREFMAVLGDQSNGRNLEAPEGLIRQIVREESGNDEMLAVLQAILEATRAGRKLYVDKRVLAETAKDGINAMTIAAGKPVLLY